MRVDRHMLPDPSDAERAIKALSRREREVLLLSAEGIGLDQIAATIGTSERRVARILVRAILKFDRALHKADGAGRGRKGEG